MLKDSQTLSQAALSDLRPAYTLFLNEFQDYQTDIRLILATKWPMLISTK